ncbi:MAG: class I SAM-dependent methyltransferase [Planctomycetaceae bacterium]
MGWSARRIAAAAAINNARTYLEIGVKDGDTFLDVGIERKDGVDPAFSFDTSLFATERVRFFSQTSDEFWVSRNPLTYDVIFLDGMHTFEQTMRDLVSSMRFAHARTIWLIDDTLPSDVFSSIPHRERSFYERKRMNLPGLPWHGDVYKLVFAIHDFIPVLNYATITGSGNPQTLAWYAAGKDFAPAVNCWEAISRKTFFDIEPALGLFRVMDEHTALAMVRADLA